MMHTLNYQNYINILCIIDNFEFLSTHLILCILVTWFPDDTPYHSLLLQSATKQLLYINELIACQLQPLVLSYIMISSLAEQSSTSLFTNMIERWGGMRNVESCKNSLILLQIEAFKYIIRSNHLKFILT